MLYFTASEMAGLAQMVIFLLVSAEFVAVLVLVRLRFQFPNSFEVGGAVGVIGSFFAIKILYQNAKLD